jgi:dipeptidyl aminopeptidase/acylaminoacyl peptidase
MRTSLLGLILGLWWTSTASADTKKPAFDPFSFPHGYPTQQVRGEPYSGLGAESVSPEDIARFAAQPLEASVSRHIQAMLDVRGSGGGAITANGARMFFTWRVTGTAQVWRQDGAMKFPEQLTGGEDNTSVAGLAPDDSFVVVSRDVGGSENPGLYLLKPDGGPLEVIQHTAKVQTRLAFIADDSKSVYFTANDKDPASYAIYRYDLKTRQKTLVFDTPGLWNVADHKGDQWLLAKELGNTHIEIYLYDVAKKSLTPVIGQTENEEFAASFGAKPGQILVRTNKLGDFQRLYTLDLAKPTELVAITPEMKHDVSSFLVDEPRTRIYYTVNEDGYFRLYALDARTQKPVALPRLAEAEVTSVAGVSRNGRYVQLSISGSALVPTTVVYDWSTGKREMWRAPATPEIDTTKFAKATLEWYPAADGTKIPMFVRRPAFCTTDASPCPVVVEFHGGPEGQSTAGFSTYAQMFVDAGFVFVQPNVRGSDGYGKWWLHADDGPKRLDVITDIGDCAKYIRTAWAKNGTAPRLGVTGGSYGGYATLMAMTYFAGAYDAGVEEVGISNLGTFLTNTAPYRRILRISEYGDPVRDKDALAKLSPISYVDRIKAPLLLIQGVNDPRVPVGEALQIYGELEKRNLERGLILFPDEGHGPSKRGNIVAAIGHTIAFFQKHLGAK